MIYPNPTILLLTNPEDIRIEHYGLIDPGQEKLLRDALLAGLDALADDQKVMLKLTIPEVDGFYTPCIEHPNVVKVVALSGGYPRDEANARLSRQPGMIASFSRALVEGLSAQHSDEEFDDGLDAAIAGIFAASMT